MRPPHPPLADRLPEAGRTRVPRHTWRDRGTQPGVRPAWHDSIVGLARILAEEVGLVAILEGRHHIRMSPSTTARASHLSAAYRCGSIFQWHPDGLAWRSPGKVTCVIRL